MPKQLGYIDTGDRAVITSVLAKNNGFGATTLRSEHLGMHGVVARNDGFGHCSVKLDNDEIVSCWNGVHLGYEDEDA